MTTEYILSYQVRWMRKNGEWISEERNYFFHAKDLRDAYENASLILEEETFGLVVEENPEQIKYFNTCLALNVYPMNDKAEEIVNKCKKENK